MGRRCGGVQLVVVLIRDFSGLVFKCELVHIKFSYGLFDSRLGVYVFDIEFSSTQNYSRSAENDSLCFLDLKKLSMKRTEVSLISYFNV